METMMTTTRIETPLLLCPLYWTEENDLPDTSSWPGTGFRNLWRSSSHNLSFATLLKAVRNLRVEQLMNPTEPAPLI